MYSSWASVPVTVQKKQRLSVKDSSGVLMRPTDKCTACRSELAFLNASTSDHARSIQTQPHWGLDYVVSALLGKLVFILERLAGFPGISFLRGFRIYF